MAHIGNVLTIAFLLCALFFNNSDADFVKNWQTSMGQTTGEVRAFEAWKKHFAKNYENSTEEAKRFSLFRQTRHRVSEHNADRNRTFDMEVNYFADWTKEELGSPYLPGIATDLTEPLQAIGQHLDKIDWRSMLGPPRNQYPTPQHHCGSCWAFSAAATIQCRNNVKRKEAQKETDYTELSVQQLVDCSTSYGNKGCTVGNPRYAYRYISDFGGLNKESTYPYAEQELGQCLADENDKNMPLTAGGGYATVSPNSESALIRALQDGCVTIAMDCTEEFWSYKSGIYRPKQACSLTFTNHIMTVVGYTQDAWIVRNTVGTQWGQDGHVFIARDAGNVCSMLTYPSYPLLL